MTVDEILAAEALVSASKIEKALKLGHGTVKAAALAGEIPYAARKATRGRERICVRLSDAIALWGAK